MEAGTDAIGFVLYDKSPRYVDVKRAAQLARLEALERRGKPEVEEILRVLVEPTLDAFDRDPVLRGEWLREGTLVCAIGANDRRSRELDNVVLDPDDPPRIVEVIQKLDADVVMLQEGDAGVSRSNGGH